MVLFQDLEEILLEIEQSRYKKHQSNNEEHSYLEYGIVKSDDTSNNDKNLDPKFDLFFSKNLKKYVIALRDKQQKYYIIPQLSELEKDIFEKRVDSGINKKGVSIASASQGIVRNYFDTMLNHSIMSEATSFLKIGESERVLRESRVAIDQVCSYFNRVENPNNSIITDFNEKMKVLKRSGSSPAQRAFINALTESLNRGAHGEKNDITKVHALIALHITNGIISSTCGHHNIVKYNSQAGMPYLWPKNSNITIGYLNAMGIMHQIKKKEMADEETKSEEHKKKIVMASLSVMNEAFKLSHLDRISSPVEIGLLKSFHFWRSNFNDPSKYLIGDVEALAFFVHSYITRFRERNNNPEYNISREISQNPNYRARNTRKYGDNLMFNLHRSTRDSFTTIAEVSNNLLDLYPSSLKAQEIRNPNNVKFYDSSIANSMRGTPQEKSDLDTFLENNAS